MKKLLSQIVTKILAGDQNSYFMKFAEESKNTQNVL